MEILRKLRWILYPSAFILVFIVGAFFTFPKDVLREMAESSILGVAMGMGPKNRGVPEVSLKEASPWRFSGVNLHGLKVTWPGNKGGGPLAMEIDSLRGRLGIFSLLTGSKSIISDLKFYDGDVETYLKVRRQGFLGELNVAGSKVDLGKMAFIESLLGAPLAGILNLSIDLNANSELSKDGSGSIKLNLDNLSFGPGNVTLPAGGFVSTLSVPKVNLGKLQVEFVLDKGQLDSKTFNLSGGDLEADLKVNISLGRKPSSSRLTGDGWFSVKREFVNANETLKTLFELIPELRAAQQGDGKVGISLRGNLARPQPRLERYTGAKKEQKKDPVAKGEK